LPEERTQREAARVLVYDGLSTALESPSLEEYSRASSIEARMYRICVREKKIEFANIPLVPKPLVTGRDLILLGIPPGPEFGKILHALKDAQLENAITTQEEAIAWVKRQLI
jgi:hypothetical protein